MSHLLKLVIKRSLSSLIREKKLHIWRSTTFSRSLVFNSSNYDSIERHSSSSFCNLLAQRHGLDKVRFSSMCALLLSLSYFFGQLHLRLFFSLIAFHGMKCRCDERMPSNSVIFPFQLSWGRLHFIVSRRPSRFSIGNPSLPFVSQHLSLKSCRELVSRCPSCCDSFCYVTSCLPFNPFQEKGNRIY